VATISLAILSVAEMDGVTSSGGGNPNKTIQTIVQITEQEMFLIILITVLMQLIIVQMQQMELIIALITEQEVFPITQMTQTALILQSHLKIIVVDIGAVMVDMADTEATVVMEVMEAMEAGAKMILAIMTLMKHQVTAMEDQVEFQILMMLM